MPETLNPSPEQQEPRAPQQDARIANDPKQTPPEQKPKQTAPNKNGRRRPVSAQPGQKRTNGAKPSGARRPAGGPPKKEEMDFGHIMRTVLLWAAMLLGVIVLIVIFNKNSNPG